MWEVVPPPRGLRQSRRQIAHTLGLDRRTGRKDLAADEPPVYPARRPRPTPLTPSQGSLAERWTPGCHQARRLDDALVQRGEQGSARMVRVVVRPGRTRQARRPALTPSRCSRLMRPPARRLTARAQDALAAGLQVNPRLAQGDERKPRLHTLRAERALSALEPWLQAAATAERPSGRAVAPSLRQADEASTAALTTPGRTGQGEGQMCRVKLITRFGSGRAQLDRLRQRLLPRMVPRIARAGRGGQAHLPAAA
jgi:transposase